jgi:hypothetical protein
MLLAKALFTSFITILIYREIFIDRGFIQVSNIFLESLSSDKLYLCFLVVMLMPFNWLLESVKWKTMVDKFSITSIWDSLRMVIVGLTFGILTPSRLGEYAGRFYMMKKGCKWNTISATFVGSLAQNIVTGIIGVFSAIYLIMRSSVLEKYIFSGLIYVVLLLVFTGGLVYYNVSFLHKIIGKFSANGWTQKIIDKSAFLENLTTHDLHKILFASTGRYLIYATQYLLLLKFFGIDISLSEGCSVIGLLFLIQSGLPLPPILGVMARGELAIAIWSLYTYNTLGIIATTFSLWFINLIIPAIIGLVLILDKND